MRAPSVRRRALAFVVAASILTPMLSFSGQVRASPIRARPRTSLPPLATSAHDGLNRALHRGQLSPATYALDRALALFHRGRVRARFGQVATPARGDATLILRDLVLRSAELSAEQRVVAMSILARPTDGAADKYGDGYTVPEAIPYCTTDACVHYVTSTDDAPDLTDANGNGIPDYVDQTAAVIENVWNTEVTTYGYRALKSDITSTNHGPDGRIDIYIAELGDQGLFGYCTTDDPNAGPGSTYQYWDVSAYCVVDNDFSPLEFPPPGANGLAALEVTLAHEFFHAVQFGYDFGEDSWFMEGTATWMEDEVYTDVNDNRQYLRDGQLRQPGVPLDRGRPFSEYGDWIFWRFLEEYFGTTTGPDPTIVRRTWELADGSATGPNDYSLQAVSKAVAERGADFHMVFARFAAVNVVPAAFYNEGSFYPSAPMSKSFTLTKASPSTRGFWSAKLAHLSSIYSSFTPGTGVKPAARLRVVLTVPRTRTGPEATLVQVMKSGAIKLWPFDLARSTRKTIPFGRGSVSRVVLAMSNASTRFACWKNTVFSCQGVPRDDGRLFEFAASVVQ